MLLALLIILLALALLGSFTVSNFLWLLVAVLVIVILFDFVGRGTRGL